MGRVSAPEAAPPAQIKTNRACSALPTMFRACAARRVGRQIAMGLRFDPFASLSSHRPPRSDDAIGGTGGPNSGVCGRHRLDLLIGCLCLHGRRAHCEGIVRRRVVGFGRARSLLLSSMATTRTKARDNESEDGARNDPHLPNPLPRWTKDD
jgi:hypothetical protein